MKYFKFKFLMFFAALALAIPSAWAEDLASADFTTGTNIVTTGNGSWTYAGINFASGYVYLRSGGSITYTDSSLPSTVDVTVVTSGYTGSMNVNGGTNHSFSDNETYTYEDVAVTNGTVTVNNPSGWSPNIAKITISGTSGGGGGDEPTPTGKTASIVFGDNESDGTVDFNSASGADLVGFKEYTTVGADLIAGIQCSKVYKGATGLKFSTSSVDGYLIITLAPSWKATKITVNAKKWTSGTGKLQIYAGEQTSSTYTLTADYADYDLVFNEATSIPTIRINATNRLYVKSITIEYVEDGGDEPTLQQVALSFPQATYTATMGEGFTAPVLTVAPSAAASEVVYSSSNTAVATVAADGTVTLVGAGTTTITAAISDSETYEDASASYELTVEEAVQPGSNEYVLVTNINQLQEGKKILIVNANSKNLYAEAMGRQQSNNRKTTTVQVSEDKVTTPVADTEILTLEKDGDYWLFKTTKWPEGELGYLYAAGANSNNYLRTEVTADNKAQATVTIANDGEATVVFNITGTNPRNILRHNSSSSIFACYGNNAGDQKPVYFYIEKSDEPVVLLDPEMEFSTDAVTVYAGTENFTAPTLTTTPANLPVTYSQEGNTAVAQVNETTGAVTIGNTPGTVTIYANFAGNDEYNPASASYTITVEAKPELVVDPEELTMEAVAGKTATATFDVLGTDLKGGVTIAVEGEGFTVEPTTIAKDDAEEGATVTVTYAPTAVGEHTATITVSSEDAEPATVAVTGTATAPEIAAITFSPEAGSYTEAQTVTISCATDDAELTYSIDGGQNWQRNRGSVTVNVDRDMTLMAKAVVAGVEKTATAVYSFEFPVTLPTIEPLEGYYFVKNNGNNKYANVVGRKTLRFTETPDAEAGTVIYVKTDNKGQVQSLRSQACDLQGYANKAMNYVPDFVHLVAEKLELEGVNQLFGETGVDAILDKFNACFDYHLYVEEAQGGYRIYGKTPSMQPVVEFYRENQAKVDAKLPMLEDAINNAIDKILDKTNGSGASILEHFNLHTIWEKMDDANLIEPTDDASTMAFYHQVLMNKDYVWSFAYETAMIYWTKLKEHEKYETEIKPKLGEFAEYIDKIDQVRPNFKYYIVQKNDKPDFISQGNGDIDAARSIWTVEPRTSFTVNVPEANVVNDEYVTTLYTDFGYTLPEGVTAYKVTAIDAEGYATTEAIGNAVPAQTPVLLKATAAGDQVLTLNPASREAIEGNLLVGPDYLIGEYQIKSPTVKDIFDMVKGLFGETIYNNYMTDYEHLMLRYAGTVNNKYFWRLSDEEIEQCIYIDENNNEECIIRSLDAQNGEVAFYNNWTMADNKAFLVNTDFSKIMLDQPVVEVAAPTFTPEAGSYTAAQNVEIACETPGAVIYYSTNGGNTWTEGNSVEVGEDMTLMAKAVVGNNETPATAVYSFEFPVDPITMEPLEGYYFVKNNGNNQYANVVGRKTLRFTETPDAEAGTVIRVKTDNHGKVLQLRSQAADLQRYAERAMSYVPEMVHLVAEKLELEGVNQLFGETGVDAILDKFNEAFDYHLYVEPVDGGYRIYGKTPSMQPVVEFYRENQAKCDAKLPGLEAAINRAIEKILEKTNGSGASILTPFSLHTIWEKMNDANLIEPTDDASTLAFYHQVLMNKDYVWSFAYETAMIYWTKLKEHEKYETEIKPKLGEFAEYIDKIDQVRPNFKYYIVQKDNKPDFISEGNVDITGNAARTIWTVEPRNSFTVNVPEENLVNGQYVTTLYTDFAYDLPEGVTAYKVTGITGNGIAVPEKLDVATVPAQTPVLLFADQPGDAVLTLNTNDGDPVYGNLLVGPDYLIRTYQIKSPTIKDIFDMVKGLFGETIYNNYLQKYEYLQLRYSGMVHNRYFWRLSDEEIEQCIYIDENNNEECIIRSLDAQNGEVAFYNNWTMETNKAFLVSEEFDPIRLQMIGDVNRDGMISIADVTAMIDILLLGDVDQRPLDAPSHGYPRGLDYDAADFNCSGEISVLDVSNLIDFLLLEQGIDPNLEDED